MRTKFYRKIQNFNKAFLIIISLFYCIFLKAQLSFVDNGQELNNLAGRGVALADLNNDGTLDAFVVNENGPDGTGYRVYFGDGSGRFTDEIELNNPVSWSGKPVICDINSDGIEEIITGTTIWFNDRDGNLTPHSDYFSGLDGVTISQAQAADLNDDGSPDIFATVYDADFNTGSRVLFNDGDGYFTDSGQRIGQGSEASSAVILEDFNDDGYLDAVVTGWRQSGTDPCPNRVWINDGLGYFQVLDTLDEGQRHSHSVATGDFNRDGYPDIIIGTQGNYNPAGPPYGRIYLNNGQGRFTPSQTVGTKLLEKVETNDLDGDGDIDLFLTCDGGNEVWLNNGDGSFENSGLSLGSEWTWSAAIGDLNGDAKPDIFGVNFAWINDNPRGRYAEIWLNTSVTSLSTAFMADGIKISPNPVTDQVKVSRDINTLKNVTLELFDIQGNRVISERIPNTTSTIDLTAYPEGLYFVNISSDRESKLLKLIKK